MEAKKQREEEIDRLTHDLMEIHEAEIDRMKSDHKNELETSSAYSQALEGQMHHQLLLATSNELQRMQSKFAVATWQQQQQIISEVAIHNTIIKNDLH